MTLLHSEWPKLYTILAFLSAKGLKKIIISFDVDEYIKRVTRKRETSCQSIPIVIPLGGIHVKLPLQAGHIFLRTQKTATELIGKRG